MDSIKYDITATSSPMMPKLGRGTECLRLLISQISPDMREVIVPMLFPALGAYISETEFMYPDNTWKKHRANRINISPLAKYELSPISWGSRKETYKKASKGA